MSTDATVHVWCEVEGCRREEDLAPRDAFQQGWDFAGPGGTVPYGAIAPRTCPDHGLKDGTLGGGFMPERTAVADPTDHQRAVMERIAAEKSESSG